jgi:RES domain-containing protein
MVYTAATLSLAALELFINLDPDNPPPDLVSIEATILDDIPIESVSIDQLPSRWRDYPGPDRLQEMGAAWLEGARTAVLSVPSAVIPGERNLLLNPAHPRFSRIQFGRPRPFGFDPRMWK